jgi:pyruvate carboxylase
MHRYKADESYQIANQNELSPIGAYLAMDHIIQIAKEHRVKIVHPGYLNLILGYGFLAENAHFAQKVIDAGMKFVGPEPDAISKCGDKTKARELAIKANVPVVPGSDAIKSLQQALDFVNQVGFPIIIKAAFGGGGRGMRVVRDKDSFPQLFERAKSEALASFGDGTCFIERFIERPRHIEVQLLGDEYGNIIHLYDRDCSVQRRHQKVVEMAPCLTLPDNVRKNLLADAVKLAKEVGYKNAGTAEFLVDQSNRYYFIEINPRIQVEHTVTEEITGIDIVAAQIQIALGCSLAELDLTQENINCNGFAIQCRVTTEDPMKNFQPDTGRIEVYRSPAGRGVRLDGGPGYSGAIITPHYDSLLAKCTCLERNFEKARRKMICALKEFRVRGLKTNVSFLVELLSHATFVQSKVWTTFIDDTPELFKNISGGSRGQKLLGYLGDMAINNSRIVGQSGVPVFQNTPSIPNQLSSFNLPCTIGWRSLLVQHGPEVAKY